MKSGNSIGDATIGGTARPLLAFSASESLSEPPHYTAEIAITAEAATDLIGAEVEIALADAVSADALATRTFAGVVTQAEMRHGDGTGDTAALSLTSWMGMLAYGSHSALYQNLSSVEILKAVLKRRGLDRRTLDAAPTPPRRATCIQYDENDLDFVARLLAEDNIAHFVHDGRDPTAVILHDAANPYPALSRGTVALTDLAAPDGTRVVARDLTLTRRFAPGKVAVTSYDAESARPVSGKPSAAGGAAAAARAVMTEHQAVLAAGTANAAGAVRARQAASGAAELVGRTAHPALHVGQTIDIASGAGGISGEYVIRSLEMTAGKGAATTLFRAVPRDVPVAPARRAKPRLTGMHTATVVGDTAGQPACDASGRVRVKFAWDIDGPDTDSSGWIRVAESHAGAGYGGRFTPRAGQEVLVSFLQGDPDAPVITGRVYNGKSPPPFATPNTTRSGIVTKLDGPENALEFDDRKDAQCLSLRAAKDLAVDVKDSATRTVAGADSTRVGKTATIEVGEDLGVTVKKGAAVAAETLALDIDATATATARSVVIEAESAIELKVGQSSVKLTASGVVIDAPKVTLNATTLTASADAKLDLSSGGTASVAAQGPMAVKGLNVSVAAQVKAELKGNAMAEISGSGLAAVKGALVQIN